MATSKIEWTDYTHNPWWGCVEVGPECDNCYARSFSRRLGFKVWGGGDGAERRFFSLEHHRKPFAWNDKASADGVQRRVFCASMADVFERMNGDMGAMLDAERARLWATIENTPNLTWLLLTKRPRNVMGMVPERWHGGFPPNVHMGTTAGCQQSADANIPHLRRIPAAAHFVSAEPLLEPVVLRDDWLEWQPIGPDADGESTLLPPIRQVIVGGESGARARPMDEDWVRALRNQCVAHHVAFFYKQRVEGRVKLSLPLLDGRRWHEFPEVPRG